MENVVVHIISHSHWDREWYLPFESHRNAVGETKAHSLADIQVIQDQLTEHHVGPREPFTRVESWVIYVEAFMHNTCTPITSNQLIQQEFFLCLISCCQTLDRKGDWPDIAIEGMRTSETASVFSLIEVRIFLDSEWVRRVAW